MKVNTFSQTTIPMSQHALELLGVELEVENARMPDDFQMQTCWRAVEDGSLRNAGMEFISNPSTREEIDAGVEQFYAWRSQLGYTSSVRTSTHVHFNVLDFELSEVAAVLAVYAIVEPLLFEVCGPEREENIYCVPWYRGRDELDIAAELAQDRYPTITNSCKYSALYMEPMYRFGTLEFRQAPLFDTQEQFTFWLNLCSSVVFGSRELWQTAAEVVREYDSEGCNAFLLKLFGRDLYDKLYEACGGRVLEGIIDNADSVINAEAIACTYKATNGVWEVPTIAVEGNGTEGYRNVAFSGNEPRYTLDEFGEPDEYYDEDEYPEEDY